QDAQEKQEEPGKQDLMVEFSIEIKKEDIENKFNETLLKYASDVKLPGFRKGKAPLEVVKNRFKDAVSEEVIGEMMNEAVVKKIEQDKLKVVSQPAVKKLDYKEGTDLKADMVVEVQPEVNLPDLEALEVEIPAGELEIESFDEQKAVEQVLEAQQRQAPVSNRGIKDKDMVTVKYQSKNLRTKKMERRKTDNYIVQKDSHFEIIDLYGDIIGKETGAELTLKRKYPADYKKKIWAGKEMEHYIEIENISEMVKPELDENFLKPQGFKDEAEFTKRLKDEHQQYSERNREEKKFGFIMNKLNDSVDIPIPQGMVEQEMGRMIKQNPYQFNVDPTDKERTNEIMTALKSSAEKSLRFSFIAEAVTDKFNLKVSGEDMEKEFKDISKKLGVFDGKMPQVFETGIEEVIELPENNYFTT
ncbi:MAG: trigger factor, partial [bacterium]|nr:trigger factor [bacterium]